MEAEKITCKIMEVFNIGDNCIINLSTDNYNDVYDHVLNIVSKNIK